MPTTTWIQPASPLPSMRIIAGSYERLLYGLQADVQPSSTPSSLQLALKPIFQFPAHPSSIKCLATAGPHAKWLVTAGADELIKIWDLRRKKEVGSLSGAESFGPPMSLSFPLPSHLLLSAEGVILLYRTRDWALLHTFKGHTGRVNFVSTHPSAKLALSGGQDGVLRAWDLTRGKNLGGTKMGMDTGGEMEQLRWFGGGGRGDFFALLGRTVVRIFRRNMNEVARIGAGTTTGTRLNDIAVWDLSSHLDKEVEGYERLKDLTLILVAREDKKVGVYLFDKKRFDELDRKDAEKEEQEEEEDGEEDDDDDDVDESERTLQSIATLEGHSSRVKSLALQPLSLPQKDDDPSSARVLTATTISSDGQVRIFNLDAITQLVRDDPSTFAEKELALKPCASYDTKGARLTTLSVVGGDGSLPQGKADDDEEEGSEDDEDAARGGAASESEFESEFEGDADDNDEAELKRLEEVVRKAQKAGIDLDELVRMAGESGEEGSDGDDDMDGEVIELEGEEDDGDDSGDEGEVESD